MQKLLRMLIVILVLVVFAAIMYTQTQLYLPSLPHGFQHEGHWAAAKPPENARPLPMPAPAASPVAAGALGTSLSPLVVKLADVPESPEQAAEHARMRATWQSIERNIARLAATSRAQNFLLLFQAIIYFLTLILLYLLMENVRKFADAAGKSAEAAGKSAELAQALLKHSGQSSLRKPSSRLYNRR